jgi:hypothetical protein
MTSMNQPSKRAQVATIMNVWPFSTPVSSRGLFTIGIEGQPRVILLAPGAIH